MLLLLASLACFGLLASCSNETQDVYVTNFDETSSGGIVGTVEGSFSYTGDDKYEVDSKRFASVKWEKDSGNANILRYILTVPVTISSVEDTTINRYVDEICICKIDGKYYLDEDENSKKVDFMIDDILKVEGSLDGSFTVTNVKVDQTRTITTLKFTKK